MADDSEQRNTYHLQTHTQYVIRIALVDSVVNKACHEARQKQITHGDDKKQYYHEKNKRQIPFCFQQKSEQFFTPLIKSHFHIA